MNATEPAPDPAHVAQVNAFRYFNFAQIGEMFGIGERSMKYLISLGAPVVAKKLNPDHFKQWLWENRDRIGKLQ